MNALGGRGGFLGGPGRSERFLLVRITFVGRRVFHMLFTGTRGGIWDSRRSRRISSSVSGTRIGVYPVGTKYAFPDP